MSFSYEQQQLQAEFDQETSSSIADADEGSSSPVSLFLLFCNVLWFLVAAGTYIYFPRLVKLGQRRQELGKWIALVRQQRDKKVHKVLLQQQKRVEPNESDDCWKTATQTRHEILQGTLQAHENISLLAHRCRKFGRSKQINAITEELYDEAFQAASNLANFQEKDGIEPPPLFGVPVCVKEWIGVKNTYATAGMTCRLLRPDKQDCLLVETLRTVGGAIPLVKGNVVQMLMLAETHNRIWGTTTNPYDLARTPGGSSGGDAALVAMGCVPLSVSSDGAGSIRIPACYCGIVGFKPTTWRSSLKDCIKPRSEDKHGISIALSTTIGPMARCVDDCILYMKAICVPHLFRNADPAHSPPVPFRYEELYNQPKKLTIGYFETDDWYEPCTASKRALRETIHNLQTMGGHKCVRFEPPSNGWDHFGLLIRINASEGIGRVVREALDGELPIAEIQTMLWADMVPIPLWAVPIITWLIRLVMGPRMAHLFQASKDISTVYQVWQAMADLMELRSKWSDAVKEAGVDVILHPAMPTPAPFLGTAKDNPNVSYMQIAPLLGWPSGVVPVTTIQRDEQHFYNDKTKGEALPRDQTDHFARAAAKVMEKSSGLPMSVSILAPAFRDETCLYAMKEIEKIANFQSKPQAYLQPVS
ncbi:Glutamyl-tRNA(Gln) amidotransferase subunit A [Seminavis robusta]|uniref:Glutamyl-tRNA(Gln) amidotransferase subunit A n=1 Tax=Seminavis robusta TaxID=568900 RepID=A0A9N8DX79_9STRA|nr:Glutamyl-tRNA(Gln) amidotransferase subunit A [Seminavis robusta]|eukprot:Sro423_g139720.1 Glutamyl-tRNA(Gln) amidotransferase subunit A (646) ;mRNA; r:4769-6914